MNTGPAPRSNATNPDQWVDAYADSLFRYALTRLRQRADAEDVVQETLLAALRAHRTFRGDSAERTWLIGILRHKIVDRIRIAAREMLFEPLPINDGEDWGSSKNRWPHPPKSWSGDPARLSENVEFWQQVRNCFSALPALQAQVFALRTFDDLSADDICKQVGVTATNLWVLLHRARLRLRACLESSWFSTEAKP